MWRAVGDGFTGASPAAPRRAAMAASALRFFTLWRRPHGDIRGWILRAAKIHQRLTAPSNIQIVHYINSSPVFTHTRRNRSRRPALGGREKNST